MTHSGVKHDFVRTCFMIQDLSEVLLLRFPNWFISIGLTTESRGNSKPKTLLYGTSLRSCFLCYLMLVLILYDSRWSHKGFIGAYFIIWDLSEVLLNCIDLSNPADLYVLDSCSDSKITNPEDLNVVKQTQTKNPRPQQRSHIKRQLDHLIKRPQQLIKMCFYLRLPEFKIIIIRCSFTNSLKNATIMRIQFYSSC